MIDTAAMYAAMDEAAKCTCEWDLGPTRTPNLRCPVHGLEDAAAMTIEALLGLAPPDSLLTNAPKVDPPVGRIFWSRETAEEWDRQYQWPEDKRRFKHE